MKILRGILGMIVGAVVAVILIMVFETVNFIIYKPADSPGFDDLGKLKEWMDDFQQEPKNVCAWVESLPMTAMLALQISWSVAAFVGGWVSARIAGWSPLMHAGIIGGLVLFFTIVNLFQLKEHGYVHPNWMIILALLMPLPLSLLAGKLVSLQQSPQSPPESNS